jgi:Holliday junction resolvasome RuvABC endonuclease subunit
LKVLGIKSFKQELGWIVLEGGNRADASIVAYARPKLPTGGRGEQLVWVRKELHEILDQHDPDVAALSMSQGNSALTERSQMDGVLLASLQERHIVPDQLYAASIRSKFSGLLKDQIAIAVAALPSGENANKEQREMLTVAVAILPD